MAAAFALSRRSEYLGQERSDPVPLEQWDGSDVTVTLAADVDPNAASGAIEDALSRLRSRGRGGCVRLPPGDWDLERPIVLDHPGVRLTGAGMRATRLHDASNRSGHLVHIDAEGVTVDRLSLRGPGAENATLDGHGIRVGHNASDVMLRDLLIEEVPSYGIGFQPRGSRMGSAGIGGVFDDVHLCNVVIRRCGQDGVDMKNIDQAREACRSDDLAVIEDACNGRRSFFRNVSVMDVGLAEPDGPKPGIDVRGIRSLQNVEVLVRTGAGFGVRFRRDPGGPPNGLGGHGSTLENFVVIQDSSLAPGIERSDTRGTEVHNGFVVIGGEVDHIR